jgi:hypothetical protein
MLKYEWFSIIIIIIIFTLTLIFVNFFW